VCANTAISDITYTIGGSASGASVSGLPAGITGSYAAGVFTISGTPTAVGSFSYTVTTTGGVCSSAQNSGDINVQAAPTLALSSAPGTDNQTACQGNPITNITYSVGGSATGVTATGFPAGVTGNLSGGTYTISGSPSAVGTYNYSLTTTGGTCPPVNATGTITVQNTTITLITPIYSNNQTKCLSTAIDTIKYNLNGTATITDLPPGVTWVYVPGAPGVVTITGTPLVSGTYYYTVQSSGICGNATVIGSITIVPSISSNSSGSDVTVCEGSTFNLTGSTLPATMATYSYIWQSSNNIAGPYAFAAGVNNQPNYSGVLSIGNNNRYFRRIVNVANCTDTATPAIVTMDTLPRIISIGNSVICSNDTLTVNSVVVQNGTVGNWTTDGFGLLTDPNTPNPTYKPNAVDAGQTLHLYFEVSSNNVCAPAKINGTYIVKVNPDPVALAGGTSTICPYGGQVTVSGALALNGTTTWTHDGTGTLSDTATLSPTYTASPSDAGNTILLTMVVSNGAVCTYPVYDTAYYNIIVLADGFDPSVQVNAGEDTTVYLGKGVLLNASGVAITSWLWSPATGLSDTTIANPIANPLISTTYFVTGINIFGCADRDTVIVTVSSDVVVFIPNLFSPNGDGMNDTFEIPELSYYPNTRVTIINREGVVVYENPDYDNSWDGTYQGRKLPEATYYYLIEFKNTTKVFKGAVTILRNEN
jgi:gliding motility-associated-like protein